MFQEIDKKMDIINSNRPLSKNTLRSLRENFLLMWTYNSNAIEGNTLTLSETKVVLEDGITIGGKTLREHLEVINHKEAILYVEELVKERGSLTEWHIKTIHGLILKGIDHQHAGTYRKEKVIISGAEHVPPEPIVLSDKMERLLDWYNNQSKGMHPVERAARLHTDFVKTHPFIDGNGRTARLLLNLEIMKEGYPPVIIRNEDRARYYSSLGKAHVTGEYSDFIQLVIESLGRSLDLYLQLID